MNGSRVNKNIIPDPLQDYDVVFFVNDINTYNYEPEFFGEVLIAQRNIIDENTRILMTQYKDGSRIDLQVRNLSSFESYLKEDSLTKIIYNDTEFQVDITPSDTFHQLQNPTKEEFSDHVNEMYWVSLYIIKALKRGQINYAYHLMHDTIFVELSTMLGYNLNIKHDRCINYGLNFKYLGHYLEEGSEYFYSLFSKEVSESTLLEVLDWYDVLVDNVALAFGFTKPDYHRSIIEYIKAWAQSQALYCKKYNKNLKSEGKKSDRKLNYIVT